jgi:hypothetical protein
MGAAWLWEEFLSSKNVNIWVTDRWYDQDLVQDSMKLIKQQKEEIDKMQGEKIGYDRAVTIISMPFKFTLERYFKCKSEAKRNSTKSLDPTLTSEYSDSRNQVYNNLLKKFSTENLPKATRPSDSNKIYKYLVSHKRKLLSHNSPWISRRTQIKPIEPTMPKPPIEKMGKLTEAEKIEIKEHRKKQELLQKGKQLVKQLRMEKLKRQKDQARKMLIQQIL